MLGSKKNDSKINKKRKIIWVKSYNYVIIAYFVYWYSLIVDKI